MSAADTVEALLKLGMSVRTAYEDAKGTNGSINWTTFLNSQDFQNIKGQVTSLLGSLTSNATDAAVAAVDAKRTALLNGRQVSQLSAAELHQMSALLDARSVLAQQQIKSAGASAGFFQWLVETALPVLIPIGKDVLALLL